MTAAADRWRPRLGHASLIAAMLVCGAASAGAGQAARSHPSASSSSGHEGHAAMITRTASGTTSLTLPESIPDFSLDASRPAIQSSGSGPWSSASTWQGGQVPTANHVVRVLAAHRVTIEDTAAVAYTVAIEGTLAFAPNVATRLKVTNLQVMAGEMGTGTPGLLEVGTSASPIAAGVSAEIVIANTALGGGVADPLQFGTGIIVLGKLSLHGSPKTPTFVRLATEPRAGHTTLTLAQAVTGWAAGDRLVLPDTRHLKESEVTGSGWINAVNQWEERTLQSVSADGKTLTLTTALQYDHLGARDLAGVLDFLPHVGNLTRNVVVRSESATGTRGHMLAIHKATVDIRHTLFRDLGRTTYLPLNTTTNHIGRYPIHMHHLAGPVATPANGYQFTLIGNAVDGGSVETKFKWGIAVHGSHYGLIQDNVVYNYNGSAIATEDGSESFNVFDHNFALRGMGQPNDSVSEARMAMGTEGVGFWFRGPNNYVRNNVAANYQNPTTEAAYGFVYQLRFLGTIGVPKFKGADTMVAAQATSTNGNNLPILQFENNEAYGAMQGGFTLWWVSSEDPQPAAGAKDSIIKDLKLWNTYNKTIYMYPSQKVIFDGLKIRGNFVPGVSRCCGNGVYFADYSSKGIVIRNSDIQGMEEGITAPEAGFGPEANLTVENSYLRNVSNLDVPTNGSVNGCWMENKLVVAINTQFVARPGSSLDAISMVRDVANAPECLGKQDEMRVYAYNRDPAVNFQVYHSNSNVLPRPPASCTPVTRPGISGPTCTIPPLGAAVPAVTFGVSPASVQSGQAALLNWSTSNATTVVINQGVGTVAAAGSYSVSPTATTTYTLTATNASGSATATATVTVTAAPPLPPTVAITASSTSIMWGSSTTLSWTTSNATGISIDQGIGTVAAAGTRAVAPTATTAFTLTATNAAGSTTGTVTVTVGAPPQLAVSHASLYFGARGTILTPPQTEAVRITNAGGAVINWTVASSAPWLTVSAGGTGAGRFTVAVAPGSYAAGTLQAQVTVASPGLQSVVIPVSFTSYATTKAPVGSFDTPADNAVNVTGAFPVTGWALHEIGVGTVDVYRDAVTGEAPAGTLIFIGTAVFVDGARPDLEAASPSPFNYRAGWGLMVLSNVLPNGGNGTYTLRAIATGLDGTTADLGRKTITCTNATAVLPFGTIDTPAQGETVSGTILNWGWALTPLPSSIDPDGSGLEIFIDGISVGRPAYGQNRADIASLFPGLANSTGAVGYRAIDTTTLANGVHTIGWIVYDRHGRGEGIGSRFFNVHNAGVTAGQRAEVRADSLLAVPAEDRAPALRARIGFDADATLAEVPAGDNGRYLVAAAELDRIEIALGATGYDAAMLVGQRAGPLPAGSRFDAGSGVFVWQPAVGFTGRYDFVFTRAGQDSVPVTVRFEPKHGATDDVAFTIDTPTSGTAVDRWLTIAGWAFDRGARRGTGIDAVHVWAHPTDGTAPIDLGVATYGGLRPDVAAAMGARWLASGFGLTTATLPPGSYDLAVFPHSSVSGTFAAAQVVRVTIK